MTDPVDLLALEDSLVRLEDRHPELVRVVECRFFGGMTNGETAEALGIAEDEVERRWTRARAHLYEELAPDRPGPARG